MTKQITLMIDNKEKTFTAGFTKGSLALRALALGKKFEENEDSINAEAIYEVADLVVDVYNKEFDRDQLIDGIDSSELFETLMMQLEMVVSKPQVSAETSDFLKEK